MSQPEYSEKESVTMSLERYESIKETLQSCESYIKEMDRAFGMLSWAEGALLHLNDTGGDEFLFVASRDRIYKMIDGKLFVEVKL